MKLDATAISLFAQNLELGQIPFLRGRAGIGKTSVLRSAATSLGMEHFTLAVNLLADKADLTGARLVADGDGGYVQSFFPHEEIAAAIDCAEANPDRRVLLILDEINRASGGDITSGALGIMSDRRIGRRQLPANLFLAATGNDSGNVAAMDEASLSRLVVHNVVPDAPTWLAYMGDRLNQYVRAVIESDHDLINGDSTPDSIAVDADAEDGDGSVEVSVGALFGDDEATQITTPRTLEAVSDWLNVASPQQLAELLSSPVLVGGRQATALDEVVEGFVGNTRFAAKLVARIAEDLGKVTSAGLPRPASYDVLVGARTLTTLLTSVSTMDDDEKADALVYALHDAADASRFIPLLAENIADIGSARAAQLVDLASSQRLDPENLRAFLESGTPLGDKYEPVLSSFA